MVGGAARAAPLTAEEIVMTRAGRELRVFDQFQFAASRPGWRPLPLLHGAREVRRLPAGPLRVTGAWARVPGNLQAVALTYAVPAVTHFLWQREFPEGARAVLLLAGPDVYPSGLTSGPFRLMGPVRIGHLVLTQFAAANLPPHTVVRWPMRIGRPGRVAGPVVLGLLGGVAVAALWIGVRLARETEEGPTS